MATLNDLIADYYTKQYEANALFALIVAECKGRGKLLDELKAAAPKAPEEKKD